MERFNRRAIIKGATATAVTLSGAIVANAASDTDRLGSLIAHHRALNAAMTKEGREVDTYEVQLKTCAPQKPIELSLPIEVAGNSSLTPSSPEIGWTQSQLNNYLTSATFSHCTRHDLPSGGFNLEVVDLPLQPETLSTMRQLRSALESYEAATETHFALSAKRQAAWEASLAVVDAALKDVITFKATSWATLHQKTDYLRKVEAFADGTDIDTALEIAESLVTDILTLTANT